MIRPGVYPAAVTPFDEKGRVDMPAVARLLAWFESGGCTGAVLAGTNGEGPSLSAPEKRDLIAGAMPLRGKLDLILGIATPSLDEAVWLCKQADQAGCSGVLLMPPYYFRDASAEGVEDWLRAVLDKSPSPVLIYNFPQKSGVPVTPETLGRLNGHEKVAGFKDSSGAPENISAFRAALGPDKVLFVGDETLLFKALEAGWSGTISGVANVLPMWLSQIVGEFQRGDRESAATKFGLVQPTIELLRKQVQPATNKSLLQRLGVLPSDRMRLPLTSASAPEVAAVAEALQTAVGLRFPLQG